MKIIFFAIALFGAIAVCGQEVPNRILKSPFPASKIPQKLYVFEEQGNTKDALLAAVTLQGLQARELPKIYCDYGKGSSLFLEDFKRYGIVVVDSFRQDIPGLITRFQQDFKGYILCELGTASINTAITLCGLLDAIAITPDLQPLMDSLGKPLLEDARGANKETVYAKYKAQLSKDILVYQNEDKPTFLSDYSVFTEAFHFNESIDSAFTQQVFSDMNAHSVLLGWGASEYFTVKTASEQNVHVLPSDWVKNLSVYSNMNAETRQKPSIKSIQNTGKQKHTVCFVYTDGDNIQWLLNDFLTDKRWFGNENRGQVDIGWTIAPALVELAPTVLKLIYERAAKTTIGQDYFIAGPSGFGYIYPSFYPALEEGADLLNTYMEQADLSIVNLIDSAYTIDAVVPFLRQENIDAVFYYDFSYYAAQNGRISFFGGKPIIGARYNLWGGFEDPISLAQKINALPTTPLHEEGYTLVPVHNWTHSVDDILECVALLDSNVQVVAPDAFVQLIKANLNQQETDLNKVHLFPNPCKRILNVRQNQQSLEEQYRIFDLNGSLIQKGKLSNSISKIELDNVRSGNYWLKLEGQEAIGFRVQ